MTARHSLYKKRSRWDKADELQKTRSSYQRKINISLGVIRKLERSLKIERARRIMLGKAICKITEMGLIKKGDMKPFLKRKKQVIEEMENLK